MQRGPSFGVRIWTHIPQERGGATFRVVACSLRAKWVARAKVVVVRWAQDERNSTVMGLM